MEKLPRTLRRILLLMVLALPVVKRRGERWPEIDTEEYRDQQRRNREGARRVLEVLTGQ
ncbi:MAG: hypothetical protein R6U30_08465 [Halomonas sp.]|uniref:hypothetical protein n=1 Tax=Halomonas sp. TaxID=1486246 RepID=UPI003970613B